MTRYRMMRILATGMAVVGANGAAAQTLTAMPMDELRPALQQRYDAAVAAYASPDVRRADDSRFTWAAEAKNQCGIAIGYTKTGTRDAESIGKCERFAGWMNTTPTPITKTEDRTTPGCVANPAVSVFFDWDIDVPPADASTIAGSLAANRAACGWRRFTVTGFTDTSGTATYNDDLSIRRARNVAALMTAAGIEAEAIAVSGRGETELKVATADGVREPQNRRAEITALAGTN